jgi:hypothetical protein
LQFARARGIGDKRGMNFRSFRAFSGMRISLAIAMVGVMAMMLSMMTPAARGADEEGEKKPEFKSPGGRFVFRKLGPELGYGIVERKTGKTIAMGENSEGITGVGESVPDALWQEGGTKFAVNYRAGGRYNTTQLFAWRGGKFAEMASAEEMLGKVVEKDRAAYLKKRKLPADQYLRRIWDTYRTLRWVDENTVEIYVYSDRTFMKEGDDELDDATISGVFTVRYNKKGKPAIISRREPTKKESAEE